MSHTVAILTGDLIGSTKAGPVAVDAAMRELSSVAARMSEWLEVDTRFTRYRGDGWQMYLEYPGFLLRACLLLIASLRAANLGLETRISVGLGSIDPLGPTGLSDASGEAFTISGHGLDMMPRSTRLFVNGHGAAAPFQKAIFEMVDWQSSRWSREQAEAVVIDMQIYSATQAEMAGKLGISRQALHARLQSSGSLALDTALRAFESAAYREMDP